jgi:hypothetical protein
LIVFEVGEAASPINFQKVLKLLRLGITFPETEQRALYPLALSTDFEIHRDTATEIPEKSDEIRRFLKERAGREVYWSLDPPHFATVKHLYPAFAQRLLLPRKWIESVRQTHFRSRRRPLRVCPEDGPPNVVDRYDIVLISDRLAGRDFTRNVLRDARKRVRDA